MSVIVRRSLLSRPIVWIAGASATAALALATWGFAIEPGLLCVEHDALALAGWPQELAGLRVAVLTDLHVGAPHMDLDRLERIVAETNATEPDVVVVLGDLVIQGVVGGEFVAPEPIAERLGRLRAPAGVFAVLGNHDWWYDGERVGSALTAAGIVVLEDRAVRVEHDGAPVWIAGISDVWTRAGDVEAALGTVDDDAPVLAITHNPDVFPRVPERVALTFAGHTHGGQIDVPLFGPPVVPSEFGQRYAAGHVVEGGRHLFVGTGVGTSILPVRIGVVPRIDVIAIVPE